METTEVMTDEDTMTIEDLAAEYAPVDTKQ
jgi:hypothetical protein